jgi:hypothetical protein
MKNWDIANKFSGHHLGVYEAATAEEALNALAKDAGYASYADVLDQLDAKDGELVVTEVERAA